MSRVIGHSVMDHEHTVAIPWTVADQAPLTLGISQVRILGELPCPSPGDLRKPGIEPTSPVSYIGRWILYHYAPWKTLQGIEVDAKATAG